MVVYIYHRGQDTCTVSELLFAVSPSASCSKLASGSCSPGVCVCVCGSVGECALLPCQDASHAFIMARQPLAIRVSILSQATNHPLPLLMW